MSDYDIIVENYLRNSTKKQTNRDRFEILSNIAGRLEDHKNRVWASQVEKTESDAINSRSYKE